MVLSMYIGDGEWRIHYNVIARGGQHRAVRTLLDGEDAIGQNVIGR